MTLLSFSRYNKLITAVYSKRKPLNVCLTISSDFTIDVFKSRFKSNLLSQVKQYASQEDLITRIITVIVL